MSEKAKPEPLEEPETMEGGRQRGRFLPLPSRGAYSTCSPGPPVPTRPGASVDAVLGGATDTSRRMQQPTADRVAHAGEPTGTVAWSEWVLVSYPWSPPDRDHFDSPGVLEVSP